VNATDNHLLQKTKLLLDICTSNHIFLESTSWTAAALLSQDSKLQFDEPLSNSAFNFKSRRYKEARAVLRRVFAADFAALGQGLTLVHFSAQP
jgi:hypothetical protein